jgi:hypothetical protein
MKDCYWKPGSKGRWDNDTDYFEARMVLLGWVRRHGAARVSAHIYNRDGPNDIIDDFPTKEEAMRYVETVCRMKGEQS